MATVGVLTCGVCVADVLTVGFWCGFLVALGGCVGGCVGDLLAVGCPLADADPWLATTDGLRPATCLPGPPPPDRLRPIAAPATMTTAAAAARSRRRRDGRVVTLPSPFP